MRIQGLSADNWATWHAQILHIETQVYEPSRRDTIDTLESIIFNSQGVSLVAIENERVAGFCLGAPLEHFSRIRGPAEDSSLNSRTTIYAADTCVSPSNQGKGIGRALKIQQLARAREQGYQRVTGRNRALYADAMWRLNRSLGARAVHIIEGDYHDGLTPDICIYYMIDLTQKSLS